MYYRYSYQSSLFEQIKLNVPAYSNYLLNKT